MLLDVRDGVVADVHIIRKVDVAVVQRWHGVRKLVVVGPSLGGCDGRLLHLCLI